MTASQNGCICACPRQDGLVVSPVPEEAFADSDLLATVLQDAALAANGRLYSQPIPVPPKTNQLGISAHLTGSSGSPNVTVLVRGLMDPGGPPTTLGSSTSRRRARRSRRCRVSGTRGSSSMC